MARKKSFDLLKKIFPVGIKGEKGIIEIPLKHTVGTIHRAVRNGIDDVVSAADVIGCSRTRLQTLPIKRGDEKIFLPYSDGI
jgi:hypothetical protein